MKLDGAEIKKYAPLGGLLLLLIVVALYARRASAGATEDAGGSYVSTPGAGDGGAAAAANAQLQSAEAQARAQAFGGLLDFNLGLEKLHTDQGTAFGLADRDITKTFGLADRQVDLTKFEDTINREVILDAQGRDHIQRMAQLQLNYQLEQGRTNAQKSVAKHNIFAQLGGSILGSLIGFL